LAVSVGAVWSPLAVDLTPADAADNAVAPRLLAPLPAEVCDALGDTAYNTPGVRQRCEQSDRALVATRSGGYPHHDGAVEVRCIFHQRRSRAIEAFNGLFTNVFGWRTQMPVKGLRRSQLLALVALVGDQLVLFYQHEHNHPLGKGIKPLLRVPSPPAHHGYHGEHPSWASY
jgi:hypothetical protein